MKKLSFKEKPEYKDLPIRLAKCIGGDFPVHSHDFHELVIITDGVGVHTIDNVTYELHTGDIYVVKGQTTHGFINGPDLRFYNIMFYPELVFTETSDLQNLPGFQALFILEPHYRKEHEFRSKLHLTMQELTSVESILEAMHHEDEARQEGYRSFVVSYFTQLVIMLSRMYAKSNYYRENKSLIDIATAVAYIQQNYVEPLTLTDIAKKANLSIRHFSRIFTANYQASPTEYVTNLRLRHAVRLMRNKNLSLTEIALQSGFTDSNYFSRRFKDVFGLTPSSYRSKLNYT